jgi:hypothetical protein
VTIPLARRVLLAVAVVAVVVGPMARSAAAGSIGHDEVARLSGSVNADQAKFLPLLEIADGCQPYAGVRDDGSYNGGLNDTGSESGGCEGNGSGQAGTGLAGHCHQSGSRHVQCP